MLDELDVCRTVRDGMLDVEQWTFGKPFPAGCRKGTYG